MELYAYYVSCCCKNDKTMCFWYTQELELGSFLAYTFVSDRATSLITIWPKLQPSFYLKRNCPTYSTVHFSRPSRHLNKEFILVHKTVLKAEISVGTSSNSIWLAAFLHTSGRYTEALPLLMEGNCSPDKTFKNTNGENIFFHKWCNGISNETVLHEFCFCETVSLLQLTVLHIKHGTCLKS
jgi:hypothetical protein